MRNSLVASCIAVSHLLQPKAAPAADGTEQKRPSPVLASPGTVVSEYSRSIGQGFREIARSQVNPSGHFERIGHFVFVYYKDENLCQCGQNEIAISPNGAYAIFTDVSTGRLTLFRAASRTRKELTNTFVGYPKSGSWETGRIVVTLEKYENGVASINKLVVPL